MEISKEKRKKKKDFFLKDKFIKLNPQERLYHLNLPLVGITGGIATGKSTFSKMLKDKGFHVIDADQIVKEIYKTEEAKIFLMQKFPHVLKAEYNQKKEKNNDHLIVDFKELRKIVFENKQAKQLVEEFIYARIPHFFLKEVKDSHQSFLFYEIPLLFEKKLSSFFDITVVISASQEDQIKRIIKRDHCSLTTAKKIISSQMDIREKVNKADFVIINEQDKEKLKVQLNNFLQKILK